MDPFENMRNVQRMLDGLRPALEEYDRVQRQFQASMAIPVRDIVREFEKNQQSLRLAADFLSRQQALFAAIQPINIEPTYSAFLKRMNASAALFDRLNVGIESASFLGEVQVEREQPSVDREAEELQRSAESQLIEVVPAATLESLKRVEFAPLTLLDQVLGDPEIMRRLHAREFEGFVASLVEQLGFEDVVLTPRSGDGGRDVLATKRVHGLSIVCAFECKRHSRRNPVGPDIARALLGTITHGSSRATKGVLVTTSSFTPAAKRFILTEPNLDGKDFDGVVDWLREYSSKKRGAT